MEIYTEVSQSEYTSYSCILFEDKIAIYFLNFHIKGDTCFIDKLDSTGYTKKYKRNKKECKESDKKSDIKCKKESSKDKDSSKAKDNKESSKDKDNKESDNKKSDNKEINNKEINNKEINNKEINNKEINNKESDNKYSSRDFVLSILNKYCRHCKIIFCFSLSSPVYVFNNTKKYILKNLNDYWTEIFKIYNINNKIYTLTTSSKNHLKDIYKSTDDIVIFEDEPVSKILQEGKMSLGRVYEILSCRSDFMKGALIYSVRESKEESVVDSKVENKVEKGEEEYQKNETKFNKSEEQNQKNETKVKKSKIKKDIKEILQNLNFEGDENIEKSSKYLAEKLELIPFDLKIYKRIKKEEEKENITILKVKRRK